MRAQFKIRTQCLSVAKAKRQLQMFSVAKAKRQLQLRQGEIDRSRDKKKAPVYNRLCEGVIDLEMRNTLYETRRCLL